MSDTQKKMVVFSLIIFSFLLLVSGCGNNTAPPKAPDPKPDPPEVVVKQILEYQQYGQWQQLYKYLHPDSAALTTEEEYIADKKKNAGAMTIKSFEIKSPVTLEKWTDTEGTGKTYTNVAEIPVSLQVDMLGKEMPYKTSIHLVQDDKKVWKYFGVNKKNKE